MYVVVFIQFYYPANVEFCLNSFRVSSAPRFIHIHRFCSFLLHSHPPKPGWNHCIFRLIVWSSEWKTLIQIELHIKWKVQEEFLHIEKLSIHCWYWTGTVYIIANSLCICSLSIWKNYMGFPIHKYHMQ